MGVSSRARAAAAGAAAATVWGLLEPLDERLFRSDYRDVALLGKLVTRGRGWQAAGFVLHAANGALVDAKHPRRGERHLPPLLRLRRFAQETFRHAVFGLVLGSLVERNRSRDQSHGGRRR